MEPVKTCATCRHSVVGRRDPMDWWKRRLCAHPGLVDRVEGRPIHEAESARGKDGPCGLSGALWEPTQERVLRLVDPVDERAAEPGEWLKIPPELLPRPARKRRAVK